MSATRRAAYQKVEGSVNPFDLLTKALPAKLMKKHMETLGANPAAGRSEIAASADLGRTQHNHDTTTPDDHRSDVAASAVTASDGIPASAYQNLYTHRGIESMPAPSSAELQTRSKA